MEQCIVVFAGASGSGKTTVAESIIRLIPSFEMSRSYTSRPPRGDGKDYEYVYVSRDEFESKCKRDEMVEYTEYSGTYYGTAKEELYRILGEGKSAVLVLDLNGVSSMKRLDFGVPVITVYLYADLALVSERLASRMLLVNPTEEKQNILYKRIAENINDYRSLPEFAPYIDAFVANIELDDCINDVLALLAEESSQSREYVMNKAVQLAKSVQ